MRHEDYPCCGCGPEGCIDFSRTTACADCGREYHPDSNTEVFCYGCQVSEDDDYDQDYESDEPDYED
jgi:hypothetical protein